VLALQAYSCGHAVIGSGGNQRNSPLRYGESSVTYFRITRGSYLSPLPQSPPLKTKCSLPLLLVSRVLPTDKIEWVRGKI